MTTPAEFAERWAATAAELALFFAGEPDERVASFLDTMRMNLKAELTKMFVGGDVDICAMVDRFIQAIVERKSESSDARSKWNDLKRIELGDAPATPITG
jgi:hypothetical protein